MGLLDVVRFRLGIKFKEIDKPIAEMDKEEKEKTIYAILQSLENVNDIPNKLYEIMDSFEIDEKEYVAEDLIHLMNNNKLKLSQDIKDVLGNNLVEKYFSYNSKKDFLYNKYIFREFLLKKDVLFKSVKQFLTTSEVRGVLNSFNSFKFAMFYTRDEKIEILNEAMNMGIDLSDYEMEMLHRSQYKENFIEYFKSLPLKEKINYDEKNIREDELDIFFDSSEKIIFKIEKGYYRFKENEKLEIERFIDILKKYEDISEYGVSRYISKFYDLKEIEEIIALINSSDFSIDLKEKFIKAFSEIKEDKEKFQIIEKYQKITDEQEKTKFFEQLETEYINRYYYLFTEEFEKCSKEDILQKFKNLNLDPYILRKKFNDRELFELLKKGEINNIYISEEIILNFSAEEIAEILKLNKEHNLKYIQPVLSSVDLNGKIRLRVDGEDDKEIPEEKQKSLKTIVIEYLVNGDENCKKQLEILIKNYEDFKYGVEKFPQIREYIEYQYFSIEDLVKLNEFLSDDLRYNNYIITHLMDKEYKDVRIEKLSNLLNNKLDLIKKQNNMFNYLSKEDLKYIYNNLENDDARIFFLSQYVRYANVDNYNEMIDLLEHFDENKECYIKLYKTLLNEKGEIDFSGSLAFIQKLETIKNNKEKILKLVEKNPNVLKTINYDLLDLFEDSNDEEFYARYKSLQKIYVGERKDFYKKVIKRLNEKVKNTEGYIQKCLDNLNIDNEILHKIEDTEDIDKMIFLLVERPELLKNGFQNYELIRDFEKNEEEYYKRTLENPNSTLENILDVYTRKFFNMTYFDAKSFVSQYEDGMQDLLKRYETKENLTIDEELEVSSLNRLRYLKEILNIKDIEALKECYETFSNNPDICERDYFENLMCEENIRRAYTKEKKENLYVPNLSDKVNELEYEGEKIDVLKPKGNFNILLTVVGAYVKNDAAKQNPKEEWNTNEKLNNHGICTSLIANNNMSMAFRKGVPIFGFYNIGENSIYKEAEYDLGSNSEDIEIRISRQPKFRLTKEIINRVRLGHSETVLERRAENPNDETDKRQPDFIVAINKVDEVAKKAAKEFDVPIVLLNTKDIAKEESEKITNLQREFEKNPSSGVLQTIIEDYHNNYAGLITLDKKSCKKYFEPKKMEKGLERIISVIDALEDSEKKAELLKEMREFLEDEEQKRKLVEKKYIPFSFISLKEKIDSISMKNMDYTSHEQERAFGSPNEIINSRKQNLVKYKSKKDNALENVIEQLNER